MSGTRSILKKKPASHKKTLRFKPDDKLVMVRHISNKVDEEGKNWRRSLSQTDKQHQDARREAERERIQKEEETANILLPLLDEIKQTGSNELKGVRGMKLTKKRRDSLAKIFRPHTEEQKDEIASTLIQVSRSKEIPLKTVIESVKTASQTPPQSRSRKIWNSFKSIFTRSRRGGRKRIGKKSKK